MIHVNANKIIGILRNSKHTYFCMNFLGMILKSWKLRLQNSFLANHGIVKCSDHVIFHFYFHLNAIDYINFFFNN